MSVRPADLVHVGLAGLQARAARAALAGLGIAIGIAAMVSVLGISESSRADLLRRLDRLGTNLLTVGPGQTLFGEDATLPAESTAMIQRIDGVQAVSAVGMVDGAVYRHDHVPEQETNGIAVRATDTDLLETLGGRVRAGTFLNEATARYPAVVLGAKAAERLGIGRADGSVRVLVAGRWFTVVGILDPLPLAPELDSSALVGFAALPTAPSTVYLRARPDAVTDVRAVLARTANPRHPEEIDVSRPSDALAARAAADTAFTALLVGLGAVALLVGGVGVANVMVISVLERRPEIGLRRALGAARSHIRLQFLTESLLLSGLGGAAGVLLGVLVTGAYAASRGWSFAVPPAVVPAGVLAAVAIGGCAGLYPAMRAARLAPTEALRSV